jgi:hypothetical protein
MKFLACVLLAVMIGWSPVAAAVEQCRFIQSKVDREACYDRQAKALAARGKPDIVEHAKAKSLDEINIENEDDRLKRSLRGICRGC